MEELEKNETSTQAEENAVSLASAQALADALAKIEAYTPTTWVDNSSPDIDAEHLNKPEQAIKRVTDALNSAVDVIKDLQSQVTKNAGDISTVNNNLSKAAYAIPEITLEDILDLSIPDGVYKAVPSTKNLPQTQYGKVEIYSDKTNQWRFVRYTTTQPSRVWITFYNGYGSTVGWNDWEQIATKSDLDAVKAKQINRYVSAEKNTDTVLSSYENKEGNFILQFTSNDTTGTIPTLTGSHLFIIEHFMVGDNSDSAIERAYSTKGKLIAWRFKQWWNKTWTAWENS